MYQLRNPNTWKQLIKDEWKTIRKFADETGVHETMISKLLKGKEVSVGKSSRIAFASTLNEKHEELFVDLNPPEPEPEPTPAPTTIDQILAATPTKKLLRVVIRRLMDAYDLTDI